MSVLKREKQKLPKELTVSLKRGKESVDDPDPWHVTTTGPIDMPPCTRNLIHRRNPLVHVDSLSLCRDFALHIEIHGLVDV